MFKNYKAGNKGESGIGLHKLNTVSERKDQSPKRPTVIPVDDDDDDDFDFDNCETIHVNSTLLSDYNT